MCNAMPREDFRFIKKIQVYMLDSTNMTNDEAWSFGFRIWQSKEWLTKYLLDDARNDIAYEQGKADAIDEFIAKIEEHIAYSYEHNICYSSIMSIAEQMKEKKDDLSELDS